MLKVLRYQRMCSLRGILVLFWALSTVNIFLSPVFPIPVSPESHGAEIRGSQPAGSNFFDALLKLALACAGPSEDFADTAEDAQDKIELVPIRFSYLHTENQSRETHPLPSYEPLLKADLEKTTPPPKIG